MNAPPPRRGLWRHLVRPRNGCGTPGPACASRAGAGQPEGNEMLWTIVVILLILWALGFAVHIGGGLIHLLLVIALIVVVVRLLQGRSAV